MAFLLLLMGRVPVSDFMPVEERRGDSRNAMSIGAGSGPNSKIRNVLTSHCGSELWACQKLICRFKYESLFTRYKFIR